MTPHPNDMRAWDTIVCQRGHDEHRTRSVTVNLNDPHAYHDYPQVPARLAPIFDMVVFDPDVYPVDNGPYCPAHDAVSATILSHGIWEPQETALVLAVCNSEPGLVLDFGAQIGWFSLLALSAGCRVRAYDADPENLRVVKLSAAFNGWGDYFTTRQVRIDAGTNPLRLTDQVRFVKVDVEGAEHDVIRMLRPALKRERIDHLLIEVSPVFRDDYAALLLELVGYGYRAYTMPPKQQPPYPLDDPEHDLVFGRFDRMNEDHVRDFVASEHQFMVWLRREGASW